MKYWLPDMTIEGLQIFSDIKVDYSKKITFSDATGKEGKVDGSFIEDYPFFLGIQGEAFSKRIIDTILKVNPEGIEIHPILLTLPGRKLNNDWYEITISAHVDCIDFKRSELKLRENGSIQRMRKLVVDEEKADRAGYDIFRLHGRFTSIVVSDRIKQAIESVNPIGIRFKPTNGSDPDWY